MDIDKILYNIQNLKTTNDLFLSICELSKVLQYLKNEDYIKIVNEKIYISFIKNVFSNTLFSNKLLNVLEEEKKLIDSDEFNSLDKEDKRKKIKELNFFDKQFVQTALHLAGFMLANVFKLLSAKDIVDLRRDTLLLLDEIRKSHNRIYTLADINFKLYDIILNFEYQYKIQTTDRNHDFNYIFKCNSISRCLFGITTLIIPQSSVFQAIFKDIIRRKSKKEKFSIPRGLCNIYNISRKIKGGLDYFQREYKKNNDEDQKFDLFLNYFITNNEKNILFIFEKMTSDFHIQKDKIFSDVILNKIDCSKKQREILFNFAKDNFKAYGSYVDNGDEWSNKIYLISNKTLSTLETINTFSDKRWKINVALYELAHWIDEIHKILNKYDIEDDWDKIENLLKQENSKVEWKSTFLTPTEELFISDEVEKKKSKIILLNIVKAMLGMMNTDGGIILVGLVENPQSIKREDIKRYLIKKNNFIFFDINYEFTKKQKNADNIKREIQDVLFSETLYTADMFNNLWHLEPIEIKDNYKVATIYKIDVSKSNNYIYSVKKENSILWATLLKRADGRTIMVDPRVYLSNGSANLT